MSSIIDAVSIVLTSGDQIFAIQRQNFLKSFPGYWAFPGGKVEKNDESYAPEHALGEGLDKRLMGCLVREAQEELGFDLRELLKDGKVNWMSFLGLAVTPDFNPYRFATYFFRIDLKERPSFKVDTNEAQFAEWMSSSELLKRYNSGTLLAVPPVIKVIERLGEDPETTSIDDLNLRYDNLVHVPYIESLKSVRQIMPLSNTLPPAVRTNAFLIGDDKSPKVLIDPSPKDDAEYDKFIATIKTFGVDKILLTHHHSDHYERSNRLAKEMNLPILLSRYTHMRITRKLPDYFEGVSVEFVKEGDFVTEWLGRKVTVYEIPGHDEGQIAIAPEDLSWFLAGDLFQGVGTVVIGGEEGDMSKYFQTLERVISLAPKVLYPSHGIGLGGTHILERTLQHRKLREQHVLEFHRRGETAESMLEKIYVDVPQKLWPYALENIKKHLDKLKKDGLI